MSEEKKDPFGGNYKYLYYFIHDDKSLFGKGLPLEDRRTLDIEDHQFTMATVGVKFEEFLDAVKLLNSPTRYIAILKIPVHYLGKVANGSYYPMMPMIDSEFDFLNGEINYVTPNLVLGVYDKLEGKYKDNEGYNLWYEPNGLQYTKEQIEFFKGVGAQIEAAHAEARWLTPRKTLKREDKLNDPFLDILRYYQGAPISMNPNSRRRVPPF